jgi:hypothetical protein
MLNLVLSLVGVMNNMKINQYQIHQIIYGYRMWFNVFNYTNIPKKKNCAKICIIVKNIIGKGIFCNKIFLQNNYQKKIILGQCN